MLKYAFRRLLGMIPMLLLTSIVVFTLAKLMPGDSLTGEIDPRNTNPQYIQEMRDKLGYNDPMPKQYFRWISNFSEGNLENQLVSKYQYQRLLENVCQTPYCLVLHQS